MKWRLVLNSFLAPLRQTNSYFRRTFGPKQPLPIDPRDGLKPIADTTVAFTAKHFFQHQLVTKHNATKRGRIRNKQLTSKGWVIVRLDFLLRSLVLAWKNFILDWNDNKTILEWKHGGSMMGTSDIESRLPPKIRKSDMILRVRKRGRQINQPPNGFALFLHCCTKLRTSTRRCFSVDSRKCWFCIPSAVSFILVRVSWVVYRPHFRLLALWTTRLFSQWTLQWWRVDAQPTVPLQHNLHTQLSKITPSSYQPSHVLLTKPTPDPKWSYEAADKK